MANIYNINNKKILFLHIPKTGGSSIDTVLKKYSIDNHLTIGGHPSYSDIKNLIDVDIVFTVVRNTWDWRASWYHYLLKDVNDHGHKYEYNKIKGLTFKEHLKWLEKEPIENLTSSIYNGIESKLFIKPQSHFIMGCDNIKILRFENLKSDFEGYMKELGLEIKLNLHIRKSSNDNYKDEYDTETIKIVKDIWEEDIKVFGYEY